MSKLRVNIIEPYSGSILNLSGSLNFSGQVSASSFIGDGSGLTGVTSYTDSDTLNYINSRGVVSGSSQISFTNIVNKPTLVSGSQQITFTGITNKPTLVSGSSQVDLTQTINYVSGIKTRLNSENVVSGSVTWNTLSGKPSGIVSGSGQISALGFTTCTGTVTSVATGTGLTGGAITTTGTISLSHLGFQNLTDPNADRVAFWDDSTGAFAWLTMGSNLSITDTTLNATDTNTTYTATNMLDCIKTVDGASSGLDADLLDGNHASAFYLATNPSGYTTCTGTVTSVGGTGTVAGLSLSGTVTSTGNLTLGGTLSTPVSTINDSTTVGQNLVKLTNPSAIRFIRINADNTVSALSNTDFNTATGATTCTGTVTSIATNNGITGGTITSTGTIGLTGQALALHNLATNGVIARTGAGTVAGRTITGTANQVTVTNGDGVSGNPTLSLPQNVHTGANFQINSLGVGTAASATAGEIRATNNITAYYSSDIRLKENIKKIDSALEKLNKINGVTFNWKEEYIEQKGGEDGYFIKKNDIGVIAQEVEEILPQIVANREDGYKGVRYEMLVPLLIEAIKELHTELQNIKGI